MLTLMCENAKKGLDKKQVDRQESEGGPTEGKLRKGNLRKFWLCSTYVLVKKSKWIEVERVNKRRSRLKMTQIIVVRI